MPKLIPPPSRIPFARRVAAHCSGLAFLLILAGCATPPLAPSPSLSPIDGPSYQGQALWQPPGHAPELAGDVVVVLEGARRTSFLQFGKPAFPIAQATIRGRAWWMEFPQEKLRFSGRRLPPARFLWLQLLRALQGEPLPTAIRFTRDDGQNWTLTNTRNGESIRGYLKPQQAPPEGP